MAKIPYGIQEANYICASVIVPGQKLGKVEAKYSELSGALKSSEQTITL